MSDKISVLVRPERPPEESYAIPGAKRAAAIVAELDVDTLREQLTTLAGQIDRIVGGIVSASAFALKEIKIGVEISSSGGFRLIGSLEVEGKAALELTFKRE